jgi:hypothetical protein
MNLLFPVVLDAANVPSTPYHDMLRRMVGHCDKNGDYEEALCADWRLIQYDMFHGEKYLLDK